jgi:hypothetical protein
MSIRWLRYPALLFIIIALSACGSGKATEVLPSQPPLPTAVPATSTPLPPSDTPTSLPTETPLPTATATIRPTPTLGLADTGVSGWCMPVGLAAPVGVAAMPANAKPPHVEEGVTTLFTEDESCTFVVSLNQPLPAGMKLQFYDTGATPFVEGVLTPANDNPYAGLLNLTHPYIINPPFWEITYRVDMVNADGSNFYSGLMKFKRSWTPGICYGGVWPDPVTMECPKLPEAHPWDPWYGWDEPK